MAKRKVEESDEESAEYSDSESSSSKPKPKQVAKRTGPLARKESAKKKPRDDEESEAQSSEEEPVTKKPRREEKAASGSVKVLKNKEGDKYIDLGKKKHATVRAFKNIPLLDIREFYNAGGEDKPGKKGISLTLDQWNSLKEATETIDKLFADLKK